MYTLTTSIIAACFTGMCAAANAEITTNGNDPNSTDVGIWYCTYYGEDWKKVGGMGYKPTMYLPLCSNNPTDYRYYNAADTSVIDFHLQQIANAKIDFLLFELTPGGLGNYRPAMKPFVDNARIAAKRIKAWNDTHKWKIKYAIAAGSHPDVYEDTPVGLCMEKEAEEVYNTFYNNPEYGGPRNYYQLNGKPLIVYWGSIKNNTSSWNDYTGDKTYGSKFTIRYASDVISGSYGWNIYSSGTVINEEVEVVSPGWGHYNRSNPPYVSRRLGDFYRNCWNTVLDISNPKPKIVMIVAFNDYLENTAVWTADTTNLTDADKWYGHDQEMHNWMYWDITVGSINILRNTPSCKIINGAANKVLDALNRHNGEKPYIWDDIEAASQQWQIVEIGGGLCKIVNNYTGQALDAGDDGKKADLYMFTDTDSTSQKWEIVDIDNGLSKIINISTGKVLDCRKKSKGTAPCMSEDTGAAIQKWRIDRSYAIINNDNPSIIYSSGWFYNSSAKGFIFNDCHTSSAPGSSVEYKFKGKVIKVIGDMNIDHGMMDIYIDGKLAATIDAYSPEFKQQQELYANSELSDGNHTIKLVISTDKNPKAVSRHQSIDAFKLM